MTIPIGFYILTDHEGVVTADAFRNHIHQGPHTNTQFHTVVRNPMTLEFDPTIHQVCNKQPAMGRECVFWQLDGTPVMGEVLEVDHKGDAIVSIGIGRTALGAGSIRRYSRWMYLP